MMPRERRITIGEMRWGDDVRLSDLEPLFVCKACGHRACQRPGFNGFGVEDIDHTRTKAKSPQTNGICERFYRTVLDEFYRVAFREENPSNHRPIATPVESRLNSNP